MNKTAQLNTPAATGTSQERRLVELLDRCLAELQAGRAIDRYALIAENPDLADELGDYLDSLQFISAFRGPGDPPPPDFVESLRTLGDYRLIREVGRGGMGIVYEAEQISLGRRVGLKVLPFAAMLDPRQLQRFKNEALAAASLDHPNIVEVHAVGCERGVHFYAMRYVEGQTLAAVIDGLKCGAPAAADKLRAEYGVRENTSNADSSGVPNSELRTPNSADTVAAARSLLSAPSIRASFSARPPSWASKRPKPLITPTDWALSTAILSRRI